MAPVRLQLSRKRGFDLQGVSQLVNGLPAVNVARPSIFGNEFLIGPDGDAERVVECYRRSLRAAEAKSLGTRPRAARILKNLESLRGKNLACWCKPGEPCHADVLLEFANR
jgi:hypothetical protein